MQTIRTSRSFTTSDLDSETFCGASVYVPTSMPMVVLDDQARIEQYWAQIATADLAIVSQWRDLIVPSLFLGISLEMEVAMSSMVYGSL